MITRDLAAFGSFARACRANFGPACAKGVFLVAPAEFELAVRQVAREIVQDEADKPAPLFTGRRKIGEQLA